MKQEHDKREAELWGVGTGDAWLKATLKQLRQGILARANPYQHSPARSTRSGLEAVVDFPAPSPARHAVEPLIEREKRSYRDGDDTYELAGAHLHTQAGPRSSLARATVDAHYVGELEAKLKATLTRTRSPNRNRNTAELCLCVCVCVRVCP